MTDDTEARWNAQTAPAGGPAKPAAASVFDGAEPRFDELSELGRGGMGRVAEARDRALDRTVAIKHMLATDGVGLARFEREVRITARLQHPGIVPILDAGRDDDGHPYYVMRKIDGVALADRVAKRPVRDRLALVPAMLAAVDAVAYAHAQGIVHRDIKPWNILLGSFGEALMIDWGLARDLGAQPITEPPERPTDGDPALTRLGLAYGTPGFMSPEQARGESADRRADVYSLGATLYFVLAGATPFAGAEPTAVIDKVAAGAGPDLAKIPAEVPVELVAIVTKALAASPDARYPDAGELADDLRRFLAGQLVAAHRYTPWQRVTKWTRKHRLVAAISAGAIAVIAIGGVWSISRIVTERDHARDAQTLAESRADDLVIDRARSLADVDPTSAIAVLRALPAASTQWPTARAIVRAAVGGGVERLVAHHPNRITAIAFSPHGRLASSSLANGNGDGDIQIHDLAHGSSKVVSAIGTSSLAWLDERTLVTWSLQSGKPGQIALFDADRGVTTPIPITSFDDVAVSDGRAVVRRTDGSVVSFGVDGALATLADSGIDSIDASGGRTVMANRERMIVVDRDGSRHERAITLPSRVARVRVSHDGRRVAAQAIGTVSEWAIDSTAPPLTWPRTTTAETRINYAGDQLYSWSSDGTGVARLEPERAVTRWLAEPSSRFGLFPAEATTTTVFASKGGRLAYASEVGLVEIPHRPEPVARVALDPTGRRLAIGTDEGALELVDLDAVIPAIHPLARGERLYAVGSGRLITGRDGSTNGIDVNVPQELEIVELATGARHELPPLTFQVVASIRDRGIVLFGGDSSNASILVTDLDGNVRFRQDHIGAYALRAHLTFATETGDVVQLSADGRAQPHVIARFEPKQITTIDETPAGVVVLVRHLSSWSTSLVDEHGSHPLVVGGHEAPNSFYASADGTWWNVENFARVWRRPPGGSPIEVPLGQMAREIKAIGSHLYVSSRSTIFELAPDGRILRSTSCVGWTGYVDDGYALATAAGPVVVDPVANVRRVIRLPRPMTTFRTSPDATMIAVEVPVTDDTELVAIWRDPVPANPDDIPAYIERLTNAHLDPGSDELRWDAP